LSILPSGVSPSFETAHGDQVGTRPYVRRDDPEHRGMPRSVAALVGHDLIGVDSEGRFSRVVLRA